VSGPASGAVAPAPIAGRRSTGSTALPEAPPQTNLPAPTSELIGRATALAEVTELLGVHRLVTLIGAGGIGKTRLALEVARDRGGGAHGRGAAARQSARPRAGDQPRAAARAGGVHLSSALA